MGAEEAAGQGKIGKRGNKVGKCQGPSKSTFITGGGVRLFSRASSLWAFFLPHCYSHLTPKKWGYYSEGAFPPAPSLFLEASSPFLLPRRSLSRVIRASLARPQLSVI